MQEMTYKELLPCPFCGNDVEAVMYDEGKGYITCEYCNFNFPDDIYADSYEQVRHRWNTRAKIED